MGQIALHAVTEASDRHFLPATFRGKKKTTLKSLPYLNIKSPVRFRSFFFQGVPFILVFPLCSYSELGKLSCLDFWVVPSHLCWFDSIDENVPHAELGLLGWGSIHSEKVVLVETWWMVSVSLPIYRTKPVAVRVKQPASGRNQENSGSVHKPTGSTLSISRRTRGEVGH